MVLDYYLLYEFSPRMRCLHFQLCGVQYPRVESRKAELNAALNKPGISTSLSYFDFWVRRLTQLGSKSSAYDTMVLKSGFTFYFREEILFTYIVCLQMKLDIGTFSSLSLGKFKPPKTSIATNGSLAWKLNDAPVFFKELHQSNREFRHHRAKEWAAPNQTVILWLFPGVSSLTEVTSPMLKYSLNS